MGSKNQFKPTDFPGRGQPSTHPGTDENALRIQLSQKLTNILVEHGDEKANEYRTPGANGYPPKSKQYASRN